MKLRTIGSLLLLVCVLSATLLGGTASAQIGFDPCDLGIPLDFCNEEEFEELEDCLEFNDLEDCLDDILDELGLEECFEIFGPFCLEIIFEECGFPFEEFNPFLSLEFNPLLFEVFPPFFFDEDFFEFLEAFLEECFGPGDPTSFDPGLAAPEVLNVTTAGDGGGTVLSVPESVNCGVVCTRSFAHGMKVALSATPSAGSSFTGWSGDCTGTTTCEVTMNRTRNVTASFEKIPEPVPNVADSSLLLTYVGRTDTLRAELTSTDEACLLPRWVSFLKERRGEDRLIANRRTWGGVARLPGIENPRGNYYATVGEVLIQNTDLTCGSATSNMLTLGLS